MGRIADNVELTRFALGIKSFQEWFDQPLVLSFRDLPYLPVQDPPLLEKAAQIVQQMRDKAAGEYDAGFLDRTQSGMPAWIGPPGLPETRPIVISPEDSSGTVLNWKG